ncbi:MAG: tryptophan synthase subunit alpha [Gammaproteobacteria bacterium]|nr:tryptophan synthase subunit alpha [Gammaproteobacteria bacterium]
MSRLQHRFDALRAHGRVALIPFLTAGDPKPEETVALMHALVAGGADVLELGVPFSDPMAEGPPIQRACERALKHGITLADVLALVADFRRADGDTPVVLMGYLNPLEVFGYARFAQAASEAGVDGVITVDIPPEEADEYRRVLGEYGLDPVFLLAPTTTEERIARICDASQGFVYYVSLRGVTGAANLDVTEVAQRLAVVRRHTDKPVGVGFGINDAESAAQVAPIADAVIVGSAIVNRIEEYGDRPEELREILREFVAGLRHAIDGATAPKVSTA